MKKMLFLVAIALVGMVSSCKKDETTEPTAQERLIGKWKASKAIIGTTNAVKESSTSKTELEVEFTQDGKVVFTWINSDLTATPPAVVKSNLNGVYSWSGETITITVQAGSDTRTIIGSMVVTETDLVFTGTSGDLTTFISVLEASRI